MTVDAKALLAVQLLDSEIDQINARRLRLPQRVTLQTALDALAKWTAAGDAQRALIAAANESIEQSEAAGGELDKKQARLEAQLKTVIAPREAEALMHEIDGLKAKHSALDDIELAAMEQQSNAEEELAALALREPALAAQVAEARDLLDRALTELADEEAAVSGRRASVDAVLTDADRGFYAQMRKRHGAVAICTLDRHSCTGCHVDLSQVEFERVVDETKAGLAECPHCGRTLVI
jgi:uncharacterized protein